VASVEPDGVIGHARGVEARLLGGECSLIDVVIAIADDQREPRTSERMPR
jgi:hypothetical protein